MGSRQDRVLDAIGSNYEDEYEGFYFWTKTVYYNFIFSLILVYPLQLHQGLSP